MEIGLTKISSKGQVVIPANMRKNLPEGERLIIIKIKDQIIMKKADSLDKNFQEDLEFAKKTEDALKRIEKGKGTNMDFDEFIEEMKQW